MPSSGYPIENFTDFESVEEHNEKAPFIEAIHHNASCAIGHGLFIEWLESFIGAYNYIRQNEPDKPKWEAANIASQAGIIEWDM